MIPSMAESVVYEAAHRLHKEVTEKIPRGSEYKAYRKGLAVVSLPATGTTEAAAAVVLRTPKKQKGRIKSNRTVLYVRPKIGTPLSDRTKILIAFSPWTADTLPFPPKKD